jgi:hypothetical protein
MPLLNTIDPLFPLDIDGPLPTLSDPLTPLVTLPLLSNIDPLSPTDHDPPLNTVST